jgi:hypothetical protein
MSIDGHLIERFKIVIPEMMELNHKNWRMMNSRLCWMDFVPTKLTQAIFANGRLYTPAQESTQSARLLFSSTGQRRP